MQIIGNKFEDSKVLSAAYFAEVNPICSLGETEGGVKI